MVTLGVTVIIGEVLFPGVHRKVYAPLPPEADATREAEPPGQKDVAPETDKVSGLAELTVMVPLAVAVHAFASVTVTV